MVEIAKIIPTDCGSTMDNSLAPLPGPNLDGLGNGWLLVVAWSRDGKTLYAGGFIWGRGAVLAWADAGRGTRRTLPAASNTVMGLAALPEGRLCCLQWVIRD